MEEEKKKKISKGELTAYIFAGLFAVWGIVFFAIGLAGDYFQGLNSDNWVVASENSWLTNWSNMGYREWGLIIFLIGALIAFIALNVAARSTGKDDERASRRKSRQLLNQPIEAEIEEVKETPSEN